MRDEERRQRTMLMEQRISKEHPLRRIKHLADAALKELSPPHQRITMRLNPAVIPNGDTTEDSQCFVQHPVRLSGSVFTGGTTIALSTWNIVGIDERGQGKFAGC
jgi:hypothetical protein